jgi:hypothetical protein
LKKNFLGCENIKTVRALNDTKLRIGEGEYIIINKKKGGYIHRIKSDNYSQIVYYKPITLVVL